MLKIKNAILNYLVEDHRMMVPNLMLRSKLSYEEALDSCINILYAFFKEYGTDFDFITARPDTPYSGFFFGFKPEHYKGDHYETPEVIRIIVKKDPDIPFKSELKNEIGKSLLPQ